MRIILLRIGELQHRKI